MEPPEHPAECKADVALLRFLHPERRANKLAVQGTSAQNTITDIVRVIACRSNERRHADDTHSDALRRCPHLAKGPLVRPSRGWASHEGRPAGFSYSRERKIRAGPCRCGG